MPKCYALQRAECGCGAHRSPPCVGAGRGEAASVLGAVGQKSGRGAPEHPCFAVLTFRTEPGSVLPLQGRSCPPAAARGISGITEPHHPCTHTTERRRRVQLCFESLLDHLDTKSLQQLVGCSLCSFVFFFPLFFFKGMSIANKSVNVTHHTGSKF